MMLLTKSIERKLLENGRIAQETGNGSEYFPVVKLFTPDAQATWLLTEMDPDDPDRLFGLCDLGLGFPELGYVSLSELRSVRGKMGLPIERDRHFSSHRTISEIADASRESGRVTV